MELSPHLLEKVRCPQCKGRVEVNPGTQSLDCTACRVAFPVRDNIALLLMDEARPLP